MDALYAVLVVVLLPYAAFRFATDAKTRSRWRAYGRDLPARYARRRRRAGPRPAVWIHGVSVGEVKAVQHLVRDIERGWPSLEVLLSTSTDTGRRVALERYPGRRIEFYPPDLSWVVRDAFDALRPDLIVLVESGFWPTFLGTAHERGIPVAVVNGRMSARSAGRYALARAGLRQVLGTLAEACVQLDAYGERFRDLGVPAERVHRVGNMKLDNLPSGAEDARREAFRALLGLPGTRPLLVAGSTHPGEEVALARIALRLAARGTPVRLLLAPRHPSRADGVEAQVRRAGLEVVRRSRLAPGGAPPPAEPAVLLDTVGELEMAYTLADFVFVGGTLVKHGGQNMMEPASLGRPVVVGPSLANFRGEIDLLVAADGIVLAPDAAGVEATLVRWLADPAGARALGERARAAILAGKGATERTLAILRPYLDALAAR